MARSSSAVGSEHGALAHQRHAEERRRVAKRPEEHEIVGARRARADDRAARGSPGRSRETTPPAARCGAAPSNTSSLRSAKSFSRRGARDREPVHADAGRRWTRRREGVRPGHVVGGAGGEDGDVVAGGEPRCASSRQCASEPPAMSAPYRWTTKASFTARASIGAAARGAGARSRRPAPARRRTAPG